jgi:hypothetical protein
MQRRRQREGRRSLPPLTFSATHTSVPAAGWKFTVQLRTMKKRFRQGLQAIAKWCPDHRHEPVEEQRKTLDAKPKGHNQYYGRPTSTGIPGGSFGRSGTSGTSGSTSDSWQRDALGENMQPSYGNNRCCCRVSYSLDVVRGVTLEEPAAVNLRGGRRQ